MRNKNRIIKTAFALYLVLLVWLVIFKLNFSLSSIRPVRDLNLRPFHYENVIEGDLPWMEALSNILIFVPFGYLLTKINKKMKFIHKAAIFFLVSFSFEAIQYILSIGATDITDVITNTAGGIVGVLLANFRIDKRK